MLDWLFSDPLAVGTKAPDFTLPDQDGNQVSLGALRGKNVVLVFYPRDETSVCTQQLCEFRDWWAEVKAKNTVVFGVNPQGAAVETHVGGVGGDCEEQAYDEKFIDCQLSKSPEAGMSPRRGRQELER